MSCPKTPTLRNTRVPKSFVLAGQPVQLASRNATPRGISLQINQPAALGSWACSCTFGFKTWPIWALGLWSSRSARLGPGTAMRRRFALGFAVSTIMTLSVDLSSIRLTLAVRFLANHRRAIDMACWIADIETDEHRYTVCKGFIDPGSTWVRSLAWGQSIY